jgi:hypothetical protein
MTFSSSDVLSLVQQALNEIDSVPISASVRRTVRIANLMGESKTAIRLAMEVRPPGGAKIANQEDTKRFLADPRQVHTPSSPWSQAVEEYLVDRKYGDDKILAWSIAQLDFLDQELVAAVAADGHQNASASNELLKSLEIRERARSRCFSALCEWERQLTFSITNEHLITGHQRRVDEVLSRYAPSVLDQFNAVYRRIIESARSEAIPNPHEDLAQAVTSCRRILKAVVDHVQPADSGKPKSDGGHALTDEQYKNRLFESSKDQRQIRYLSERAHNLL